VISLQPEESVSCYEGQRTRRRHTFI
jgi:hypothetical protein